MVNADKPSTWRDMNADTPLLYAHLVVWRVRFRVSDYLAVGPQAADRVRDQHMLRSELRRQREALALHLAQHGQPLQPQQLHVDVTGLPTTLSPV